MSRSTTAYHHGNLGPALEDAALELMRTQGHATLSLREVARRAGVSHNAPYHHFGDRTALLKRLSERGMAELLDAMREERQATAGRDPREAAVRIGSTYVHYAAQHPERFRLIYDPDVCVPGSPSEAMAPLIGGVEALLAETTASLAPGAEPQVIAALTTAVWAAVHGLAELVVAGHISEAAARPALEALLTRP
ncbi:TetR/AcrR family transcriptional regulator [Plantibacter flavus]|uniref:TetR/AcrR family transcriptional regulator n=1 Tax=Plantibacter TaxID=190323 RepID=UPI0023790EAB|nr:TetR/AcrR family transcriptional regulator [Plantibacter flavus]MDD9151062.1 TetR/AcrR family transcriptional regulator [Plantibacter flavus]